MLLWCDLCCLFLFYSVCYHQHDFLLCLSLHPHMSCVLVFVYCAMHLCLTSVSPLAFLLPLCAIHAIHLCLTSMPDAPSTPFPYHMRAAHFICACTLSLLPTRFRSQLYVSHNTRTQVENKTIFVIRDFIQSADLHSAAYYNWRSQHSDRRPKLSTIWLWDNWYFETLKWGCELGHFESVAELNILDGEQKLKWLNVHMTGRAQIGLNSIPAFAHRCTRRLREG